MLHRRRLSFFDRRLIAVVLFAVKYPKAMLTAAGLFLLAATLFAATHLSITTDQDELFSRDVPFFKNYIAFTKNFPENQAGYVVVRAKDGTPIPPVNRWVGIADAITARLASLPQFAHIVDSHVPIAQLGDQALLFDNADDLHKNVADAKRLVPLAKLWGEPPSLLTRALGSSPMARFLSGANLAPVDAETASFVGTLADGWAKTLSRTDGPVLLGDQVPDLATLGVTDPSSLGYYYVPDQQHPDQHLLLIKVFENDDYSSMGGLAKIINGIRDNAADAGKQFPEFTVGFSGRPALEADEMLTTERDSRTSEIVALSAVFIGLVLFLRSIWLAIAAELALLVGIGWTFGWATMSIGSLNLLSMVFLIALIGIGMDYLIQVLSRYRVEAAHHAKPATIWVGVFRYVAAPINTACLGAAGAFFVSVFTDFRGAAELGVIASGGLLLCLVTGYVILPPLLTLFPLKRRAFLAPSPGTPGEGRGEGDFERKGPLDYRNHPHPNPLPGYRERGPEKIPTWRSRAYNSWLLLPALWAVLLIGCIPFAMEAKFDPSLLNMQAQNLESVQLVRHLQTWSAVVLSKDLDELRKVRSAVEHLPTVIGTDSILAAYDNYAWMTQPANQLPTINWSTPDAIKAGDLAGLGNQATTLAKRFRSSVNPPAPVIDAAATLERFAERVADRVGPAAEEAATRLSQWQSIFVDSLKTTLAPFHPPALDIARLPATLRDHFVGRDGQFALYLNPRQDLWIQANLAHFVHEVEDAVAKVPNAPSVTGVAIDVYHSTSSVEKSFYHTAGYALALIFILVLLDLRNIPQTLLAISVLAMGLPMLVALMGLLHINWNFANFFGLPILIGAGHEYGVFMVHRYNEARKSPHHRRWTGWDVSDKALLLCAYVTTASFGFFWALGHHQGLKSLGLVMAIGIACIYLATLCMLRPMLLWRLARDRAKAQQS